MAEINLHRGQKPFICLIGNRNAGKSTLINALVGEEVAITSETKGTTTDPVTKSYELKSVGPVVFCDTAGLDDDTELGKQRISATEKIISRSDLILYIVGRDGLDNNGSWLLRNYQMQDLNFIPVFNFADVSELSPTDNTTKRLFDGVSVSAKTGLGLEELKQKIAKKLSGEATEKSIVSDLLCPRSSVVLVSKIDSAAPKTNLIMPQAQVLREVLNKPCPAIITQPEQLKEILKLQVVPPQMVITDSQVVTEVAEIVPQDITLTTFSLLFARNKGNFTQMLDGVRMLKTLKNKSKILIVEGCSHHISCDDIGRVKIPNLLKKYTQKELEFDFCVGHDFPEDLSPYSLVIHCGGCVLRRREIMYRLDMCEKQRVPVTNYGMVIACTQGVLERTAEPLIDSCTPTPIPSPR
jgi:[FeFe] hydrogenase H-cluster maturation GTPase HydF